MRKLKHILFPLLFIWGFSCQLFGQDLVYTPKNPAFGGDTFNYTWLLNSANAQDLTEDTRERISINAGNSLDNLAASLERQVLSSLSRELITTQFGEEGLSEGTYTLGDFQIDVANTLEGLTITIFDVAQGEQTQLVIPFF